MTLEPGKTLQQYRLVEPLGEGGMGVVWRAVDTKLDREVAIKMLPVEVATDPARLARFEREARAVGALTHPNVLAVHDFGHDGDVPYLVTELLEGETLRERLEAGPVPPRKAVELGRQIARGLAAAHVKGLVHRDLKPDNVFVTRDGRIKILDFGLAAAAAVESDAEAARAPTATHLTDPGTVLGTVDYMSPEQARGAVVDHRSDLFSFGTLFHEMLTGQRPFRRETAPETLTAILREDPPDASQSSVGVPPSLDRVVRRCLEKRPEERFQSASDLAFALENALDASVSTISRPAAAQGTLERRRPAFGLVPAALLLAGVAAGVVAAKAWWPSVAPEPAFSQLTFRQGTVWGARFGPKGGGILYSASWDGEASRLYGVAPGSPQSREMGVDDADLLSVSVSGELALLLSPREIVGFMRSGTLARMPFGGGVPREIATSVQSADWDPEGRDLALVQVEGGVYRLEYPPGRTLYETSGWIDDVRFSPDGNLIAFADHPTIGDNLGAVHVVDLEGETRPLTGSWSSLAGLAWRADGEEIWFTASDSGLTRSLHAVGLSGRQRVVYRSPADLHLLDVSRDDRVLLTRNNASRGMAALPPGSQREISISWLDWSFPVDLSDDGETVLFTEQGEGGGPRYATYLRPTRGGPALRIGEGQALDLSRDGTRVLIRPLDRDGVVLDVPVGAGDTVEIDTAGILVSYAYRLPDDDRLLLVGVREGGPVAGYVVHPGENTVERVTPEGVDTVSVQVSPDGRSVLARQPGRPYHLYPLDGGEPRKLEFLEVGDAPLGWSRNGRFLYVLDRNDPDSGVYRVDLQTAERIRVFTTGPTEPAGLTSLGPAFVTPDGKAYVYSYRRILSALYLAEGL